MQVLPRTAETARLTHARAVAARTVATEDRQHQVGVALVAAARLANVELVATAARAPQASMAGRAAAGLAVGLRVRSVEMVSLPHPQMGQTAATMPRDQELSVSVARLQRKPVLRAAAARAAAAATPRTAAAPLRAVPEARDLITRSLRAERLARAAAAAGLALVTVQQTQA